MDAGRHEGDGPVDGAGFDSGKCDAEQLSHDDRQEQSEGQDQTGDQQGDLKPVRKHRRVTTKPVPGSDPNPQPEPLRHSGDENDDRLKADKPPHWG